MYARDLYPVIGKEDYGLAATLEQLLFHTKRAGGECRITLAHLSKFVKKSRSAISRYIRWLEDQGFITVRREKNRVWTSLFIRCNIRLKARDHKADGTTDGTTMAPYTQDDTQEKTQDNRGHSPERVGPPEPSGVSEMGLGKKLDGVEKRVDQKQQLARARTRDKRPSPKIIAHRWRRLLSEYGYQLFDADDGKHLRHIKTTIKLFGAKTTEEFLEELERRIGMWQNVRPDTLKKAPPHPWALNRTYALFEDDALECTPLPDLKNPIYEPAKAVVDKLEEGLKETSKLPDDMVKPKGGGLMGLFSKSNAKGKESDK